MPEEFERYHQSLERAMTRAAHVAASWDRRVWVQPVGHSPQGKRFYLMCWSDDRKRVGYGRV